MVAEWSAECGTEDPVLVVPWTDPGGTAQFLDLRPDPYDAYLIPEAERHPALLQALRSLNSARSPVFTAKCDVWPLDEGELSLLLHEIDVDPATATHALGSYIDLIWRERSVFASRHRQQQVLDRMTRQLQTFEAPLAALECVMRPAVLDFEEAQEGYATSLYIKAAGADAVHAEHEWGRALEHVVAVLRSRELALR